MIYGIIGAVVLLLIISIVMYNSLISKKNMVDNAYYSIDVMLKKRYDLIPQLVETVRGYMKHEKDLLLEITMLRSKVMEGNLPINERVGIDNQITQLLQGLIISVEAYPDLKASTNFLKLQGAINETEEQLAASRRFYNSAVNDYHNGIQMFPSSVIASMFGMKQRNFFSIDDAQKVVPVVKFS